MQPSAENGGQSSSLCFYGSSFLTDETGDILTKAGREEEAVLLATYDLDKGARERLDWGLFRDRRPYVSADCRINKTPLSEDKGVHFILTIAATIGCHRSKRSCRPQLRKGDKVK